MSNFNSQLSKVLLNPWVALPFFLWLLFWKGFALWKTASRKQLIWFIIFLLVNTLGLLEIAYVFYLHKWDIDGGKLLAFLEKKFKRK